MICLVLTPCIATVSVLCPIHYTGVATKNEASPQIRVVQWISFDWIRWETLLRETKYSIVTTCTFAAVVDWHWGLGKLLSCGSTIHPICSGDCCLTDVYVSVMLHTQLRKSSKEVELARQLKGSQGKSSIHWSGANLIPIIFFFLSLYSLHTTFWVGSIVCA